MKSLRYRSFFCSLVVTLIFAALARPSAAQTGDSFKNLVEASRAELEKKKGELTIGTEWVEELARPTLKAFQQEFPFIKKITFNRMSKVENMQRMLIEVQQGKTPKFDITTISSEVWPDYKKAGLFLKPAFDYHKLARSLPPDWGAIDPRAIDPNGYYIAGTALIRGGIVYNTETVPADKAPKGWEDCVNPIWRGKVLFDPRNKLAALQHDPKTREWFLKWLKQLVNNKVVLNRGQIENVEKVAGGEFPLFCGVNYYSAMPLIDKGAPAKFVLPDPYPLEFGTQIHVLKWSQTPATTQLFALWMASKGQEALAKHAYRAFPWKPNTPIHSLAKGKYVAICDVDCLNKSEQYEKEVADILGLPGIR
ncbi:MAG TPA: extracellular solute-binding protein [Candidatus Acidoferrales bacterium]|nr:extracellular solute-binding protein [Candidatus Acidoferrales bacterium]